MQLQELNQVELSRRSGVSQTLISSYLRESAKAKYPSFPNLVALANALECTIEELASSEDAIHLRIKRREFVPNKEQVALLEAYDRLPEGHWLKIMIKQELL